MSRSKLLEKMLSSGNSKQSALLSESVFLNCIDEVATPVPALNIALSGSVKGGLSAGITILAAPSRHFKSMLGLILVASYMKKHKDSVCVFYDNEFGSLLSYFTTYGIDLDRVIHVPIDNMETFKFDVVQKLEAAERGEKIIFFVDSIGNLASKKELEDTMADKGTVDMTRAKVLKSIFRMITPQLSMKDLPLVAVNHVYMEQGAAYPKTIMSGGSGPLLSAQTVLFVSRSQEKDASGDLEGYNFTIIVEKSRRVREKSRIPLNVTFEKGVNRWSGLFALALEYGLILKVKKGWYSRPIVEGDKNWREKETNCLEFWKPIFEGTNFTDCIEQNFRIEDSQTSSGLFEDIPNDE